MDVRDITAKEITNTVREAMHRGEYHFSRYVIDALEKGYEKQESTVGKDIFRQLLENARIAKEEGVALCQDIHIVRGDLNESITNG